MSIYYSLINDIYNAWIHQNTHIYVVNTLKQKPKEKKWNWNECENERNTRGRWNRLNYNNINIWNVKLNDKFINYNEWTTSFEYKLPLCFNNKQTRKLHDSVCNNIFLWDILCKTFRFDGSHEYKVTKMWT